MINRVVSKDVVSYGGWVLKEPNADALSALMECPRISNATSKTLEGITIDPPHDWETFRLTR